MSTETELLQDLMLLSRAAQLVLQDEVLDGLGESAVGPTKMSLLRLLRRTRKQSVNDLARFLGQTKAAASQNIDSLVRVGLVRRTPDKIDRRCVWISLTPRGAKILGRAETLQKQALKRAIEGLPKPQLRKLSLSMRDFASAILSSSESRGSNCLQCCAYNTAGCVYEDGSWRCLYRERCAHEGTRR